MNFKFLAFVFIVIPFLSAGQSKTTNALEKKFTDSQAFFFYQNTLRMLNQKEDKGFDDLIKDVEKLKLLLIKKDGGNFASGGYKNIVTEYKAEAFEEIMTSRFEGKNFDVFLKEKDGKTKAMLVLVNDSTNLYVLDIVGSIALNRVTELYKTIDDSSDIGRQIQAFTKGGKKD